MSVIKICTTEYCYAPEEIVKEALYQNFCINSTADLIREKNMRYSGSSSEGALLAAYERSTGKNYADMRRRADVVGRVPFSSDKKYMSTSITFGGRVRTLIKGAPEKIMPLTDLAYRQKQRMSDLLKKYASEGRRVLAFAHADTKRIDESAPFKFDGFAVIADPVRKEVHEAVRLCKKANIKVKMLTGDNILTATAVARELKLISGEEEAVEASAIDKMSDAELALALGRISVIARSTPATKLRVVKALKNSGEVVAVTGDGINDAPAIRHADVGIAMGVTGSQITKEAADVVLLDDSFSTVVRAVEFGRNVYRNLQRFILFQLTVNLSAVFFIVTMLLLGYPAPFNTLQLLWINVVMDGPPALTLGLESADESLMENKPVSRTASIVGGKMFARILLHGVYMAVVLLLQVRFNFIGASYEEQGAVIFTLFVSFQIFNAFNSRQIGKKSAFSGLKNNKLMPLTFGFTFLIHVLIVQVGYRMFAIAPLSAAVWCKTLFTAASIVLISETYKAFYRLAKGKNSTLKDKKLFKKA